MRVLILYANPAPTSFGSALHKQVVDCLRIKGHNVDDCDLYDEAFDPILSFQERAQYHDLSSNRACVSAYADRVLAAEGLVLVYPVWNEGFPAIMKGFFDRVFIPGVSFKIGPDGSVVPGLDNLKKLGAVCTYGADRLTSVLMGDPPRRVVKRLLRTTAGHHVTCEYLALYDMNKRSPKGREAFLGRVGRAFGAW